MSHAPQQQHPLPKGNNKGKKTLQGKPLGRHKLAQDTLLKFSTHFKPLQEVTAVSVPFSCLACSWAGMAVLQWRGKAALVNNFCWWHFLSENPEGTLLLGATAPFFTVNIRKINRLHAAWSLDFHGGMSWAAQKCFGDDLKFAHLIMNISLSSILLAPFSLPAPFLLAFSTWCKSW